LQAGRKKGQKKQDVPVRPWTKTAAPSRKGKKSKLVHLALRGGGNRFQAARNRGGQKKLRFCKTQTLAKSTKERRKNGKVRAVMEKIKRGGKKPSAEREIIRGKRGSKKPILLAGGFTTGHCPRNPERTWKPDACAPNGSSRKRGKGERVIDLGK